MSITPHYVRTADGSCLIEIGGTRVICTASLVPQVPSWMAGKGAGWLTAEYGMLPASTRQRKSRPVLKPDSRASEIQRLIGRVLRGVADLHAIGENTLYIDCDVLEADGGTRCASITGAYVAAALAGANASVARRLAASAESPPNPSLLLRRAVAAVSVGIIDGRAVLDLDYTEDSRAEVDMNVAMASDGTYLELQGTGERSGFGERELSSMLRLARKGVRQLLAAQEQAMAKAR